MSARPSTADPGRRLRRPTPRGPSVPPKAPVGTLDVLRAIREVIGVVRDLVDLRTALKGAKSDSAVTSKKDPSGGST